jgi:hypothetical protein
MHDQTALETEGVGDLFEQYPKVRFPRDAEEVDSGSDGTHERTCDHGCTPEILARVA